MNEQIRKEAKCKGVHLWQIADQIGLTDCNFSRKLRHELPKEDRERILRIISEIAAAKEAAHGKQ